MEIWIWIFAQFLTQFLIFNTIFIGQRFRNLNFRTKYRFYHVSLYLEQTFFTSLARGVRPKLLLEDQRRLIPITSSHQQLIHHNDGRGQNFFFHIILGHTWAEGRKRRFWDLARGPTSSRGTVFSCNDYWIIYWPEPGAHKSTELLQTHEIFYENTVCRFYHLTGHFEPDFKLSFGHI